MATDSTRWSASQSASSCSWSLVVPKHRTLGWPSALAGPQTQCSELPTSRPAPRDRMAGSEVGTGVALFRRPFVLGTVIAAPPCGGGSDPRWRSTWILTWESAHAGPPACTSSINDGRLGPKLGLGHACSNGLAGYDCRGHAAPSIPHGRAKFHSRTIRCRRGRNLDETADGRGVSPMGIEWWVATPGWRAGRSARASRVVWRGEGGHRGTPTWPASVVSAGRRTSGTGQGPDRRREAVGRGAR